MITVLPVALISFHLDTSASRDPLERNRGNSPIPSSSTRRTLVLSSRTTSGRSCMRMSRGHVAASMGEFILSCQQEEPGTDSYSYIISVVHITSIGEGKLLPSTGQARFRTTYTAIVMKPFKGEVVDGRVVNVNKVSYTFPVGHVRKGAQKADFR